MSKLIKPERHSEILVINRLAAVLKEERISNKKLAEILGYEPATISKWATNTIQPPLSTFLRIALIINRDLRDFFISTREFDDAEKNILLKNLTEIAERGKRARKNKA
ncbi:XRE family transcriptional regulator [Chitinophaga lutea]|uniref:XRE family transcriptional regulator n=1 Tax=Chitinophaga lutea TaxID=2488634 RepID=A0A3N4QBU4_9BACT|nr:helix-turn-helix transcriptional regulator [Chitinophaga lutea]RPE13450.1 XRE family transcriptional regulator [Chitinophaga lutea]